MSFSFHFIRYGSNHWVFDLNLLIELLIWRSDLNFVLHVVLVYRFVCDLLVGGIQREIDLGIDIYSGMIVLMCVFELGFELNFTFN